MKQRHITALEDAIVKAARDYVDLSEKLIAATRADYATPPEYTDSVTRLNLLTREARRRLVQLVEA